MNTFIFLHYGMLGLQKNFGWLKVRIYFKDMFGYKRKMLRKMIFLYLIIILKNKEKKINII